MLTVRASLSSLGRACPLRNAISAALVSLTLHFAANVEFIDKWRHQSMPDRLGRRSALAFAGCDSRAVAGIRDSPPAAGVVIAWPSRAHHVQQVQWRGAAAMVVDAAMAIAAVIAADNGAAVAAGVIGGLALGAVIAGAAAAPPPVAITHPGLCAAAGPATGYAYCASKYRSFDPATGTYLGYDGLCHPCQ